MSAFLRIAWAKWEDRCSQLIIEFSMTVAMDPPLPVYLMDCLTPLKDKQIKERDVKGYPAKRVSL